MSEKRRGQGNGNHARWTAPELQALSRIWPAHPGDLRGRKAALAGAIPGRSFKACADRAGILGLRAWSKQPLARRLRPEQKGDGPPIGRDLAAEARERRDAKALKAWLDHAITYDNDTRDGRFDRPVARIA